MPQAQVSPDSSGRSHRAGDTRLTERRQPQRERRRMRPSTPLSRSAAEAGDHALEDRPSVSFRWRFKPLHALSAVAAGLVLGVVMFPRHVDVPAQANAPSSVTRPAGAAPSVAAPPPAPSPVAAAPAPAGGKAKPKRLGLNDLDGKPRPGKQKSETVEALVADPSDPFAPPIHLASKHKAARAGKADADFIDPFAP